MVAGDNEFAGQGIVTAEYDGSGAQRWAVTSDGRLQHGSWCATVPLGRADCARR